MQPSRDDDVYKTFTAQNRTHINIVEVLDRYEAQLRKQHGNDSRDHPVFEFLLFEKRTERVPRSPEHLNNDFFRMIGHFSPTICSRILEDREAIAVEMVNFNRRRDAKPSGLDEKYLGWLANPDRYQAEVILTAIYHLVFSFRLSILSSANVDPRKQGKDVSSPDVSAISKERKVLCFFTEYLNVSHADLLDDTSHGRIRDFERTIWPKLKSSQRRNDGKQMLLSVPIYDGFNIGQGALRGFVGTICCEEEVPQVKNFFTENLRSIQADLNHAIVDGAKNGSLDHLHTKTSALERTIESWRIFLRFLHNWSDVYFEPMSPSIDAGRVWWVEDDSVRIRVNSILDPESPIFRDKDISHEIEQLRSEWKDSVMVLMFPEFCESLDANDKYYYLQRRVKDVIEFLHLIILRIMLYIKEQQASNFAKTAAVGSVMARNMSHNFGSHVLARLSSRDSLIKATGLLENKEKGIGRIASLSSYLRTRMDFLADIVTSYERTATTMDLCQVRDFFEGQLLLLDHISGVNLRKKNIKVELQPEGSIYFACPNDFVGTHALFVIFENMIRNSAKHSEVVNEIVLTLRTEETMIKGSSLLKVLLYDNLGICRQKPELVATINDQIKGSVVDSEQRLRKGYWGVLEMKTAAMYLRRISLQEIDNNERVPEALKAVDVEGHLGYELYLEMPNEIAFVSCHVEPHWLAEKSGAWKLKTFEWGTNQLGSPEGLESYEYVVVADLDEHMMMAIDNSRGSLSKKLFVLDDLAHDVPHYMTTVATEDILNCSDREELLLFLERKWSEHQGKDQFIVNSTVRLARGKGDIIDLKRTEVEMPNVVFFDNHGDCYDDAARGRNMSAYYEPFSSTGSTSIVLQRLRQSEGKQGELLNLKLIGSANCRVAIIDERIQEIAFNDSDQQVTEVKLADILEKMNIFLPPLKDHTDHNIFFDLAYKDAKQYEVPLSRWLAEKASSGLDFLVIHIGIIEKLAGTDQNSIARWLADTQRIIGGHVTIVVVSGRGNPSNLPPGTRFVAYSNVARYVLEDHCKFQLVNILEQARNLDNE